MNRQVTDRLEFHKILDRLAACAASREAKEKCLDTHPLRSTAEAEKRLQETADAVGRVFADGQPSFGSLRDIRRSVISTGREYTLSPAELMDIASSLEATDAIRSYGMKERFEETPDSLSDMFECLDPLTSLSREIRRCILSEDEIADDASPSLKSVRRGIRTAQDRIRSELNSMVQGSHQSYLMEPVVTQRAGRFVLPVRAEYKNQVPGMVHDSSSTGSTLFIEPAAAVKLNNEIRELQLKEKQEIQIILQQLSAGVGENAEQLLADIDVMVSLDHIFARAKLALDMKAFRPALSEDPVIDLHEARHPLIDPKKVVPIDISLGDGFDQLIITGPNTGGKTVTLKTVGLLELMGLSGLFIPASEGSSLGFFSEIYADIGDEQSIEQSLSTFSAHMANIVEILKKCTKQSLCLFDELGAGTDPEEGAALAMSILNFLHVRGIRSMATTHYSELKIYAMSTPGIENASCEFDVDTLSPTYHLLIGIPGKSNAFAISRKLGLPEYVIEEAGRRMDESDREFDTVVGRLDDARQELVKLRAEADEERKKTSSLREELDRAHDKLNREHDRIIEKAKKEASDILADAKLQADAVLRDINKYGKAIDHEGVKKLEADRAMLRRGMERQEAASEKRRHSGMDIKDITIGMEVEIVSSGFKGSVTSLPDDKGNLSVLCGIINYKTNVSDLIPAEDKEKKSRKDPGAGKRMSLSHARTISTELNIIGCTVDEGLAKMADYLDDAYMSNLAEVRIVHGKGTGKLREAVQRELKKTKYVKSFRTGEYGEGDAGVTIAVFK
ncbi:MAG TPA: endonuclease MutS2 [Lachnospiraceae bacterium]|nr:endonuclease MutS2 [Lachnospiraceae bacterium]HBB59860.1 endonuclease MutS2 [Lachnospiraceae bacterium]